MGLTAGESLKDLRVFPVHCERLLKIVHGLNSRRLTIVAVGGGSVGDFSGFVASVLKRGVRLVHIPTTWLAAIDSVHGGKTALNVHGGKNQIGTFYPAAEIFLVSGILEAQAPLRSRDALGELAKIALIDGGTWVRNLEKSNRVDGAKILIRYLRDAINAKYRVVERDPKEQNGVRQILNLGHTFGHVLEAANGLSHGAAVAEGTFFALDWSFHRGELNEHEYHRANHLLCGVFGLERSTKKRRLRTALARRLLLLDKKSASGKKLNFIFLKGIGRPIRRVVAVDEVLCEARRQQWLQ
jgi:3-dehydroquinate synthase